MGESVWEFMWCLDKITRIDGEIGLVLGGKPINLSDLADDLGVHETTVSRNLGKLEENGYISLTHAPYGIVIRVMKAKKRFTKNAKPPFDNAKAPFANAKPNKTVSVDRTIDTPAEADDGVSPDLISEMIHAFTEFNPAAQKFYARPPQRDACSRLIKTHGLEKVLKVISVLPKTNRVRYFPTITSPMQLEDKWVQLEAAWDKKKIELQESKGKVAFI